MSGRWIRSKYRLRHLPYVKLNPVREMKRQWLLSNKYKPNNIVPGWLGDTSNVQTSNAYFCFISSLWCGSVCSVLENGHGHADVGKRISLLLKTVEDTALYEKYTDANTEVTHTDMHVIKKRTNANPVIPMASKNSSITTAPTTLATSVATV